MKDEKAVSVARNGIPRGVEILRDPIFNKGSAFTKEERRVLGIEGLLPPIVFSMEQQEQRFLENYERKATDLERYLHLASLQDRNETLFYRVVIDNLEAMMPVVYTPTVGLACQQFGHIFRRGRGLYVSYEERGNIDKLVRNWPREDVRVIVMTDGERILGLGDQGSGGMGIPIGKLSLYTACAGIDPAKCLPVMLDVGTENAERLGDPLYMGLRRHRVRGKDFDDFVGEFIEAALRRWPRALVQFEDFANTTAFELLSTWRDRICTFNDDIQGTAAVVLAGLYSSLRITRQKLPEQRLLFLGAGEAGVGIGDLCASAMVDEGIGIDEARSKLWFFDSKGLVVKGRSGLAHHKLRYAHDGAPITSFVEAIRAIKPTAIIGTSTIPKSFTREVIEEMCKLNERPIVLALSNPTSKSECSAEEAYTFSNGRAIFASGSPFPTFVYEGKTFVSGQANNSYIFPGVGLGVLASGAKRVTDRMFAASARALAQQTSQSDLDMGRIYPALTSIRDVSAHLGAAVAEVAFRDGLATVPRPADMLAHARSQMWAPEYPAYVD